MADSPVQEPTDREALRLILAMAPSFQGGHSKTGADVAAWLGIEPPLRMPALRALARTHGFDPLDLWPWSKPRGHIPEVDLTSEAWRRTVAADQQSYLAAVAQEFGGDLPGDAWHLYRQEGLTPAEAAAKHRSASNAG